VILDGLTLGLQFMMRGNDSNGEFSIVDGKKFSAFEASYHQKF
jgi:hypothetical protein